MKIVVGLGNPGRQYALTRHNLGFMVVDKLAATYSLAFSRRKFKAKLASGRIGGKEVILVKPLTFMNCSGEAVGSIVRYYKHSLSDLLVVYDDIDIPFGNIRLRPSGGPGTHKGMKSIIENLGGEVFPRLRVGIGGIGTRGEDLTGYVLGKFTAAEKKELEGIIQMACEAVETALSGPIENAMNEFN